MKKKIIEGYRLNYIEAVKMLSEYSDPELFALANDLRAHFQGKKMSTCMIMSAKSGNCSEDCKWCAQSRFHNTGIPASPLTKYDKALKEAQYAAAASLDMFGLVASGRRVSPSEVDQLASIYSKLSKAVPDIHLCASLGLLPKQDLQKLHEAGARRYHCNIETAPSHFNKLCTTHTIEEKVATIRAAQEVGMTICSGGIIGLGETMEQRIEMAIFLQTLQVNSIPINLLQPIANTPLEGTPPLSDSEILRTFALFRIINPQADIRFAAGRMRIKHIQPQAFKCGVSGALLGDMLTTIGSSIKEDFALFHKEGYHIK